MNMDIIRQVFLDTETTGINTLGIPYAGHRIIEIGAVEVINRRITGSNFHCYLKPDRFIDHDAFNIHGISNEFLLEKPMFNEIVDKFLSFIRNSELVIHNAPFDIGFINNELNLCKHSISKIEYICKITDSLQLARKMFPGKRNSLDALSKRYLIDQSKRTLHGALLDAEILAKVFLLMTRSQIIIPFSLEEDIELNSSMKINRMPYFYHSSLKIIYANEEEKRDHENYLDIMQQMSGRCLWRENSK